MSYMYIYEQVHDCEKDWRRGRMARLRMHAVQQHDDGRKLTSAHAESFINPGRPHTWADFNPIPGHSRVRWL